MFSDSTPNKFGFATHLPDRHEFFLTQFPNPSAIINYCMLHPTGGFFAGLSLLTGYPQELHLEIQGCVRRDKTAGAPGAIAEFRGNNQFPFATNFHT